MAKKRKASLLWKIISVMAMVFALMLVFSFLASYISPEKCVFFAYFALAFPLLLLANLILGIILLFNFRRSCLIPLLAIVINYNNIYTLAKFKSAEFDTNEKKVVVLSYNVNLFNMFSTGKNHQTKETTQDILALLSEESPDIICFQEYKDDLRKQIVKKYLSTEIGLKYSTKGRFNNDIAFGNKIFSRFPIIKDSLIKFENSKNLIEFADIAAYGDTVRVFNFHLESIGFKSSDDKFYNDLIHSPVVTENLKKGFVSMITKINRALAVRAKQSELLEDLIAQSPYPAVVCGDLNDPPTSYSYHQISKGLSDSFTKKGFGLGSSYNGKYPAYRIDYILFSDKFYCENFTTVRVKFSDHYPIISYLKLKSNE